MSVWNFIFTQSQSVFLFMLYSQVHKWLNFFDICYPLKNFSFNLRNYIHLDTHILILGAQI